MKILSKDLVIGNRYKLTGLSPYLTGVLVHKENPKLCFVPDNIAAVEEIGLTISSDGYVRFSGEIHDSFSDGFEEIISN